MSEDSAGVGPLASAISNAVVRRIAETTGRGPTKARTTIGTDAIFVVVQDTLTKGERVLAACDDTELVLRMREAWGRAVREPLRRDVEELTGRRVTGLLNAQLVEPDVAVQVFILEPMPVERDVGEDEAAA